MGKALDGIHCTANQPKAEQLKPTCDLFETFYLPFFLPQVRSFFSLPISLSSLFLSFSLSLSLSLVKLRFPNDQWTETAEIYRVDGQINYMKKSRLIILKLC